MAKKASKPNSKSRSTSSIQMDGGEVFSIPLEKLGVCTGVVSRPPHADTGLIHVYLRMEVTAKPFSPDKLGLPQTWPAAWIGLLTTKSLASKRWPIIGKLPDFDPKAFPVPPTRNEFARDSKRDAPPDLFSIETTLDEPSMSPIQCVGATMAEAKRFPPLNIVIAGSGLEKSLVRHFCDMGFTFHDVPVEGQSVTAKDVAHWNKYAEQARASIDANWRKLLPAGGKTDRGAKAGDWFGFPMPGGGFGAAIMLERPEKHLRVFADSIMLSMRRRWPTWPSLEDVSKLRAEDGAVTRQLSLIAVRDGRWRALGAHPGFDRADWPWPIPWYVDPGDETGTLVRLRFSATEFRYARVDRKILQLDEDAGKAISCMSGGDAIAFDTYRLLEGIQRQMGPGVSKDRGIVTPKRIAAWKKINVAIQEAMKRAVKNPQDAKF